MQARTAQYLRQPAEQASNIRPGLRAQLMDLELWGLVTIGLTLFLFA